MLISTFMQQAVGNTIQKEMRNRIKILIQNYFPCLQLVLMKQVWKFVERNWKPGKLLLSSAL